MKITLCMENFDDIDKVKDYGIIENVSLEQSTINRENNKFASVIDKIASQISGDITIDLLSEDIEEIILTSKKLVKLHKRIIIRIPMSKEAVKALKILKSEGIRTEVGNIFDVHQALIVSKINCDYININMNIEGNPNYKGEKNIKKIIDMYKNYNIETQVIVSNLNELEDVEKCIGIGVDGIVMNVNIFNKMFEGNITNVEK